MGKFGAVVALLFFAAVVFTAGCGPSQETLRAEIDSGMKSWVGKSETQLVARWGAPNRSYKTMDGSRELTYTYTRTSTSSGYGWYDYWGRLHYSHPVKHQKTVTRSFTVDPDGTVMAYHWEGF